MHTSTNHVWGLPHAVSGLVKHVFVVINRTTQLRCLLPPGLHALQVLLYLHPREHRAHHDQGDGVRVGGDAGEYTPDFSYSLDLVDVGAGHAKVDLCLPRGLSKNLVYGQQNQEGHCCHLRLRISPPDNQVFNASNEVTSISKGKTPIISELSLNLIVAFILGLPHINLLTFKHFMQILGK